MKVLLVTQAHSDLAKISRVITRLGGTVSPARLGYEGLERFESEHPDIILIDSQLPDIDGCVVAQKIRAKETASNWTPIVFIAAGNAESDIEKAVLSGADDYLFKPVNEAILLAKLRAMYRIIQMRTSLVVLTRKLDAANQDLLRLSSSDGLTGIPNRRYFDETLDREWRRSRRLGNELALIMCDVDHFKSFNDRYGHQAGDECLRQVAKALSGQADRGCDTPARYGGEEFSLILPDTDIDGAQIVAERARAAVAELGIPHSESIYGEVTVSLGVACMTPDEDNRSEMLIMAADRALYQAKKDGRNRVVCADNPTAPEVGEM